jgi:hypothetical protein
VKEIDKREAEIEAQPIVTAVCADQTILVKGIDHLSDKEIEHLSDKESVTAPQYECKLPVFAETLDYAFGDCSRPLRAAD